MTAEAEKMPELKHCPCCNSEAILKIIEKHEHYLCDMPDYEGGEFVECTNCSIVSSSIDDWNTRADVAYPVTKEAARDALTNFHGFDTTYDGRETFQLPESVIKTIRALLEAAAK